MFMTSMLFAPTVKSIGFATFILALCGLPSAVNGLATGTFIGIEVNKLGSALPSYDISGGNDRRTSNDSVELHILHNHGGDDSDSDDDDPHRGRGSSDALHLLHDASLPAAVTSTGELSGIYLGILNIYTTLPQLVGTAISWVVFSILEPGKSPELGGGPAVKSEGLSGIGVCLFIGAIGAGVAAGMSRRLTWIQ
jgi:solute carrier family 45 protein 1/2/4